MNPLRQAAYDYEHHYLETLKQLVLHETPSNDKAAVDKLADYLETTLKNQGWSVERPVKTHVGDQLIARIDAQGDISTLLLTHYDTVWPVGTLGAMPFKHDGDKLYGPGVLDMKAGITTGVHAPLLAKQLGRSLLGPVTLLLTSDEEIGSHHSRELIEQLAQEHDQVLVLEPGREDGAIKTGRKGTGEFKVNFEGRSAHAGNNPKDGASALRELAHLLFFAEDLNSEATQTTVNLTVAQGGSTTNVIAEQAEAKIDCRVLQVSEAERVTAALYGYSPKDARVNVTMTGGLNRPPMEQTPSNKALYDKAQQHLKDMGISLESAVVGGGSDGNFTSALGIATLDGLGSVGEGPHARHEHIRITETLERFALVTALISKS